jgi:hypothetical protein
MPKKKKTPKPSRGGTAVAFEGTKPKPRRLSPLAEPDGTICVFMYHDLIDVLIKTREALKDHDDIRLVMITREAAISFCDRLETVLGIESDLRSLVERVSPPKD